MHRREFSDLTAKHFVAQDWVDLRDLRYQPSLTVLRGTLIPDRTMLPSWPGFDIRDQGQSGRCVGFALANLVDLQRREQMKRNAGGMLDVRDVVSADMLFFMAAYHDDYPDLRRAAPGNAARPENIRSLRSAIKALYHHGVCRDHPGEDPAPDAIWQSDCYRPGLPPGTRRLPTVAQAKASREISLGAYYRLDPVLNDYHAALNDTGGVLISAQVHRGWQDPFKRGFTRIGDGFDDPDGAHAFVVVGYDSDGFLVLNSWGAGWGGHAGIPGIAHWSYADWAETVMDGWVLRLGVSAPAAFDVTVGRQGLARVMGTIRSGSTRCHQLIGHYMHLDDGFHVEQGSYPSDETSWKATRDHLKTILSQDAAPEGAGRPRKGILLWIPGSLEGIGPAVSSAVNRKAAIAGLDLYPYNVFWCNQFVEKSLEVLTSVFESCHAQVGSTGPQLDALIETQLRGVGRAFWRDIEQAARRAVHGTPDLPEETDEISAPLSEAGPVVGLFQDILELAAAKGCELHVVSEGAGALVLHELLRYLAVHDRRTYQRLEQRLDTLSVIHPAIDLPRAGRHLLPLIRRMNEGQKGAVQTQVRGDGQSAPRRGRKPPRARIYLASAEFEERLRFGVYGGSVLQLVSRSFEDRLAESDEKATECSASTEGRQKPRNHPSHPPRPQLGTQAGRAAAFTRAGEAVAIAFSEIASLKAAATAGYTVPYGDLLADPLIADEVFRTITELRGKTNSR